MDLLPWQLAIFAPRCPAETHATCLSWGGRFQALKPKKEKEADYTSRCAARSATGAKEVMQAKPLSLASKEAALAAKAKKTRKARKKK